MDEYIDIVDENGKPTGQTELKSVIHQKGYHHNTAHIWFYTCDGHILLSQRSAKKTICPLLWDVSVAGHIDAGESIETAAIRETKEEIGLMITKESLNKIGVFKCCQSYNNGISDNEFHHTFISELKLQLSDLTPQEEEVEALKLVSIKEFKFILKNIGYNNHFVPSNKAYYVEVFKNILEVINRN